MPLIFRILAENNLWEKPLAPYKAQGPLCTHFGILIMLILLYSFQAKGRVQITMTSAWFVQ